MVKLIIFSVLLVAGSTFFQSKTEINNALNVKNDNISNVKTGGDQGVAITLSAEKTVWRRDEDIAIKFTFENQFEGAVKLPGNVTFMLEPVKDDGKTRNAIVYSPVSLTKIYDDGANACQNDLTPERFNATGAIVGSKSSLALEKDAKKEFGFDIGKRCWQRMISSVYPDQNLFAVAKPGKYKLYFQIGFDTGKIIETPDKYDASTIRTAKTNVIEIEIK